MTRKSPRVASIQYRKKMLDYLVGATREILLTGESQTLGPAGFPAGSFLSGKLIDSSTSQEVCERQVRAPILAVQGSDRRQPEWRCLIPLTGFAEAEGVKGAKTRTWFSVRNQPIFAWAGLWRESAEWGPVYSGVMTDCNEAIRPVHNRMPVLLMPDEYDLWLNGSLDDALAFQARCFPDALIEMTRTAEPWVKRTPAAIAS